MDMYQDCNLCNNLIGIKIKTNSNFQRQDKEDDENDDQELDLEKIDQQQEVDGTFLDKLKAQI